MHTLRLKISDKIFDKLVWFLGKFSKNELEIINEDNEFFDNQKYLDKELKEIIDGETEFIEIDEVAHRLKNVIKKNEVRL